MKSATRWKELTVEISMNDKTEITATAMILLLDSFGEELIEKIENGEIDDARDILGFAKDKTVEYFGKNGQKEIEK